MADEEIKHWAEKTVEQLSQHADLEKDEFIFLVGEKYRKYLIPKLKNYKIPLKGLGIGKQLEYLKQINKCQELHNIFNNMKRYDFSFNPKEIPLNGVYILFEKGEQAHGKDRIVRIGTHDSDDRLRKRLRQHFHGNNKDSSIFRKNIGRALLNKDNDPFLEQWNINLSKKKNKEKYINTINLEKLGQVEEEVKKYIQKNFSFVVIPVETQEKRKQLESNLISTISLCSLCKPSLNWSGKLSPEERIVNSGLWLVNELYKTPLTDKEIKELRKLTQQKL